MNVMYPYKQSTSTKIGIVMERSEFWTVLCYWSVHLKRLFSQISHSLTVSFQLVSAIAPTEPELVNLHQTDADSQAVS